MAVRVPVEMEVVGDGLQRGLDGRLRDMRGRYVAEGAAAGDQYAAAFGGARSESRLARFAKRGSKLMLGTLVAGGVAAGSAIVGVVGTALWKGFGRLQAIDQAEAKLRGLGVTGKELESVMDSVATSVTGTAFGLDEAASAAAGALASGVEQGKELERFLALTADAATQAGTDFNSMAAIMTRVRGEGKLTGQTMQQMMDNQLFVLPMLTEAYGVSEEAMRKMVREGKISAEEFSDVLENSIGGSAQEAGNTFAGAMANMNAALGRLGARVLKSAFDQMPGIFNNIGASLDRLAPFADAVGAALGRGLTAAVRSVGRLSKAIGGLFSGGSGDGMEGFISMLQENLVPILQTAADTFQNVVLPAITDLGQYLFKTLLPVFTEYGGVLRRDLLPIIQRVAQFFYGTLYPAVFNIARVVAENLRPVFESLVKTIRKNVIPAVSTIMKHISDAGPTFEKVGKFVLKFAGVVLGLASAILGKLLPPIIEVAGWLIGKLAPFLAGALLLAFRGIVKVVEVLGGFVKNTLWPAFQTMWDGMKKVAKWLLDTFEPQIKAVKTGFDNLKTALNWIKDNAGKVFKVMTDAIKTVVGWVDTLVGGVKKVGEWLGVIKKDSTTGGTAPWLRDLLRAQTSTLVSNPGRGPIMEFANGGYVSNGGMALVGERGPELVNLPSRSRVYNNPDTQRMLGSSRGGSVVVNQNYYGPSTSGGRLRELDWTLRYAVPGTGGQVMAT